MTLNMDNISFSSFNDTFKNYESATGTINAGSSSYSSFEYKSAFTTIAMETTDSIVQVLQNFSTDPTKWHVGSYAQVSIGGGFDAQTRIDVSGAVMTVTVYVINQNGAPAINPPFIQTIEVRRFLGPFA